MLFQEAIIVYYLNVITTTYNLTIDLRSINESRLVVELSHGEDLSQ